MTTINSTHFPWAGQPDEAGCNFALAHLVQNLPIHLSDEQSRTHAETLMCAAGAIAGFAAHISLVTDPVTMKAASDARQLVQVTLADGRELLYGDAINDMLTTSDPRIAPFRLWNTLAGTAIAHGASEDSLPALGIMFGHVAESLGSPMEGVPNVPANHRPHLNAREALRVAGPLAVQCLNGSISEALLKNGIRAQPTSWVAITAQATASLLAQAVSVLDPKIAAQIAMESAIYASKLKPVLPIDPPAAKH